MNRYDIASVLAEGGQGRVYRATDRITGQACALKTGETVRAEALLALQLSHPYIARPFDAGIDSKLGQYAAASSTGPWENYEPRMIELSKWIEDWIPEMKKDKRLIAVFPTPDDKGIIVSPELLMKKLVEEMSQYE